MSDQPNAEKTNNPEPSSAAATAAATEGATLEEVSAKPSGSAKRSLTENDDAENIYSLEEIIEADKMNEEMVGAVLGASDAVNCSYDQGYVYRQALYGCATCLNEIKKHRKVEAGDEILHGICLACSYKCHANHELYELYTKRNFRCDCGNFKFQDINFVCQLNPNKEPTNTENKYNHNFEGVYCTCNKPYPDQSESTAEATTADTSEAVSSSQNDEDMEMFQCSICEDWYHAAHLPGYESFPDEETDEIVCHQCMEQNNWLVYYQISVPQKLSQVTSPSKQPAEVDIEAEKVDEAKEEPACLLERIKQHGLVTVPDQPKACCFGKEWRERLCRCPACMRLYKEKGVEYLLNKTDLISYYEKKGKEGMAELEDKLLNDQLNQMNRVSQIEYLHSFNEFKTELTDFLNEFARNGEVLKRENVTKFFEDLRERKRRKLDAGSSYYYCK